MTKGLTKISPLNMFSALCSHSSPQQRFLRSFLQKATSFARRRIGIFLFLELFLFVPLLAKRKSGVTAYILQNRCRPKNNIKKSYLRWGNVSFTHLQIYKHPRRCSTFSFGEEGAKEKVPKKKSAVLGSFARCDERQGLCALDGHRLAGGGLRATVRTHP